MSHCVTLFQDALIWILQFGLTKSQMSFICTSHAGKPLLAASNKIDKLLDWLLMGRIPWNLISKV